MAVVLSKIQECDQNTTMFPGFCLFFYRFPSWFMECRNWWASSRSQGRITELLESATILKEDHKGLQLYWRLWTIVVQHQRTHSSWLMVVRNLKHLPLCHMFCENYFWHEEIGEHQAEVPDELQSFWSPQPSCKKIVKDCKMYWRLLMIMVQH